MLWFAEKHLFMDPDDYCVQCSPPEIMACSSPGIHCMHTYLSPRTPYSVRTYRTCYPYIQRTVYFVRSTSYYHAMQRLTADFRGNIAFLIAELFYNRPCQAIRPPPPPLFQGTRLNDELGGASLQNSFLVGMDCVFLFSYCYLCTSME